VNVPDIVTFPVVVIVFVPEAVNVPLDVKSVHVNAPLDVVSVAVFVTQLVTVQFLVPSAKLPLLIFKEPAHIRSFVRMLIEPPVTSKVYMETLALIVLELPDIDSVVELL
jgi:hypothetical protein